MGGEKTVESELFAKIFPCQYSQIQQMYLAYTLTVAYLSNFSSPIDFTCMVYQNFPQPNISHVQ